MVDGTVTAKQMGTQVMSLCMVDVGQVVPFLVVCREKPLLRAPHCQDTGLRRVDDGREVLDAEHAQVRDGKRASLKHKMAPIQTSHCR